MKKILTIVIILTMLISLVACNEDKNKMTSQELSNTVYSQTNWDDLETKSDVEFKMFGISGSPFLITDFQDLVKGFVSNCSDEDGNSRVLIENFSDFITGEQYVEPHRTYNKSNATIDINTGSSFNFNITSNENDARVTSVNDALENGEYFYRTKDYVAEMLDVSVKDKSDDKMVLDGILNKFGKPTNIEITRDDTYDFGDSPERLFWYDLIYELGGSVLKISVYEKTVPTTKNKDSGNDIYMYAFVYTNTSYQQCK